MAHPSHAQKYLERFIEAERNVFNLESAISDLEARCEALITEAQRATQDLATKQAEVLQLRGTLAKHDDCERVAAALQARVAEDSHRCQTHEAEVKKLTEERAAKQAEVLQLQGILAQHQTCADQAKALRTALAEGKELSQMLANERKESTGIRTTLARHNDCDDAVRSLRDENAVLTARCAGFVGAEAEASRAKTIERAKAAQLEAELVYHGDCWDRESKLRAQAEIEIARVNVLARQLEEAKTEVLDLQRADVERATAPETAKDADELKSLRATAKLEATARRESESNCRRLERALAGEKEKVAELRRANTMLRASGASGSRTDDKQMVTRRSASLNHGNKNAVSLANRQSFATRVDAVIEDTSNDSRSGPNRVEMVMVFATLFDDFFDALAIDDSIDFNEILSNGGNRVVGGRCIRKRLMNDLENVEQTPVLGGYACADCVGLGLPCFMQFKTRFQMMPLNPNDCSGHEIQGRRDHGHWVVPGRYKDVGKGLLRERQLHGSAGAMRDEHAPKRRRITDRE
ncbi:hypothetical protein LTR53_005948 [Teratosphaeriaceae sp. CCFEE 6253]|nr:hypothetical protein LTR53_005948 [Teratosphaeriaceae sp. CCFEE 6253]